MNLRRALALLVVSMAGVASIGAQNYAHVSGVILDASLSSVPGAAVTVVNEDTGFRRVTQSEADGGYAVRSLLPGVYKITVRKGGFRTVIQFGIPLNPSQQARVDFKLVVGSVQETITVQGSAPLLNSDDASVGALASRDEIEHLPLNGRGLLSLFEMAPGVSVTPATRSEAGQFTVGGQRPNTNYFTVDGVSANSGVIGGGRFAQSTGGALPGMTAFGSLDGLVSRDALQEARIQTSSTTPEFGRLPGAQISLSSRSGSNEFHGSVFYGVRNEKLDANDWFANQQGDSRAPLKLSDFGATLGAPILRNRTFVFLSYERMRLSQPQIWRQPVPSVEARENAPAWAQPMVNLFAASTGNDLGNGLVAWTGRNSRPSRLDAGSLRIDHALTSRLTVFARYSNSPSATEFGSSPINLLDLRSKGLTTGLNLRAGSHLDFDLRANSSVAYASSLWQGNPAAKTDCYRFPDSPGPCNYLARLSIAGVGHVFSGSEGRRSQSQYEINQVTGFHRGTHSVQIGADYIRLAPARQDETSTKSVMADTLAGLAGNDYWVANYVSPPAKAIVRELSMFVKDTWKVTPRITATYGATWEFSPAPWAAEPANFLDPYAGLTPLNRPIWRTLHGNLAPRLGLAVRPTNSGRTVIRIGGGFYFDSNLSLATDLVNNGPLNVATYYKSPRNAPFSTILRWGFPQDLHLPLVKQWNVSIERSIGAYDAVSIGYVASSGSGLIRREIGGLGSVLTDLLALPTNHGESSYQSLQAQYRRRMAHGVAIQASYAWSHSIDNSSTDSGIHWAGSGLTADRDRGSSDFDVRHSFTAGFTYEIRRSGWAVDGMLHARTGFPITVLNTDQFMGVSYENIFRPNLTPGQPTWITDPSAPGGRRINRAAFQSGKSHVQGNLGRNALSGFGMSQLDLALRREFFTGERRTIQLRVEAFNALNHPNFGDPVKSLSSLLFGQSTSMLNLMLGTGSPGSGLAPIFQSGGARSLQISLRFRL